MSGELSTLADARNALLPLGKPVVITSAPDPAGDEVIVVQLIASTARSSYGLQDRTSKLLQVSCYAASRTAAMLLEEQARAVLIAAGFHLIQQFPAPDGFGEIVEYRR
ncbi:hypothetical protein DKM44_12825 [Deinococcus irradiatisoli]|uniref:Uncharacterized protein n=1 Tax=Deinococcus irradiatisoli TaxID=2202254 RepID=A0A2Z3JG93_9DEIO|nr:hypothetical protein [Deinococcus irradiatisoli]AWN24005.1 hypothetical protein DKM44_12825 [Deinococcus irradiatisoli]